MKNKTNFIDENKKKFSFLIIRLSSIGDIVLTSHLIRMLRIQYPESIIDFLLLEQFKEIFEFNPRLDNVFACQKSKLKNAILIAKSQLGENIDTSSYDVIIDLQNNRHSFKFHNSCSTILRYNKQRWHKLSLVYLKKSRIQNYSVPLNYLAATTPLKLNDDGLGLEFWLEEEKDYSPFGRNAGTEINTISIAPGAAHSTKMYPIEKLNKLIDLLFFTYNCKISLLGGKDEKALGSTIQSMHNFPVDNFCGKLTISQTAQRIDESDLFITNDTGLMHIAAARQVPTIAIFGSSVRELGFVPFRSKHFIAEVDLPCRPCSHIGRGRCPLGHFNCMNNIEPELILNLIKKLIR